MDVMYAGKMPYRKRILHNPPSVGGEREDHCAVMNAVHLSRDEH